MSKEPLSVKELALEALRSFLEERFQKDQLEWDFAHTPRQLLSDKERFTYVIFGERMPRNKKLYRSMDDPRCVFMRHYLSEEEASSYVAAWFVENHPDAAKHISLNVEGYYHDTMCKIKGPYVWQWRLVLQPREEDN